MSNELKYVTIKAKHEGCWTSYANNSIILSLGRTFNPEKNIIRAFMIMDKNDIKTIYTLKIQGKIKDVLNISYKGRNNYVVDMILPYKNSTLEMLNNKDVLVLDMTNAKGDEIWNIVAYSDQIREMTKDLSTELRIEQMTITDLDDKLDNLSSEELKTIFLAFNSGYYEYPRKTTIKAMANMLKVKESTVVYHLRRGERKVINNFISSYIKKD